MKPAGGKKSKMSVQEQEKDRVASILRRDADDAERERRRSIATVQVECGEFANLDDTVVPPTPEQMAKGGFVSYTPRGEKGTVRSVRTVRRRVTSQLVTLWSRSVIDDDLLAACKWYRDRYEASELEPVSAVAQYGESVRADPVYGHLARTQWGAEARSDYRWAQAFIPLDVRDAFELVVLYDVTITDAARLGKCRYANASNAFRRGALALHGGIAHRLQIDPSLNPNEPDA